ncbi:MAG: hypothetical protein WCC42_13770, partial [Pseudolabrys sp.]
TNVAMKADVSPITADTAINLQWRSIIAGAVCASALAYVLHAFAVAIGLSLSSTAPTWRDASWALVLLSGLYILLVALASYSFGAYIAARLRAPVTSAADSTEFRDGMHGLVVWALATLLTVLIVLATAQVASRLVAPSGAPSTSAAGENLLAYDLDRLFRSDRRPQGAESNMNYTRTEAGRILLSASSHRGMQADDRTYLVRLVTAMTGLAPADAERRVNDVIAQTKESISRARRSAVIFGFMVGASALLGAVAAWFAACAGGRARDGREELHPLWDWARPVSRW